MDPSELNSNIRNAIEIYSDSLIRLAFNYTKNVATAEDIIQEVFLSYLKKTPEFNNKEHEKAWLIRVTVNKCKNYLRSKWFSARSELAEDISYIQEEEKSDLINQVLSLPEKYSAPLHLYYYEGYSINEISEILNEKPATIGTRLARGKAKLKVKLGENGYEEYL